MEIFYQQIISFILMFLFGLLLGGSLDLYIKISKKYVINHKILVKVTDLFFGIITGVIGVVFLISINWGNLRFYIFLAIFLGMIFYYFLCYKIIFTG